MTDVFAENKHQLDEILSALRERDLSEAEIEVLDALLASDERLRSRYADAMMLFSELRRYQGMRGAGVSHTSRTMDDVIEQIEEREAAHHINAYRPANKISRYAIAALVILCVSLSIALGVVMERDTGVLVKKLDQNGLPLLNQGIAEEDAVAVITREVNVVWENGEKSYESGSLLEPCVLKIKSGLIQVEFYSGATSIIEGPAVFEVIDDNKGYCHSGKVRSYVPELAQGFTIDMPRAKVVDLGTEFGMMVGVDGTSEVQVFDGEVEVHGVEGEGFAAKKLLKVGEGLAFNDKGKQQSIAADESSFVSPAELARISDRRISRREKLWRKSVSKLREDPALALLYTFETDRPWHRVLENLSDQVEAGKDGAIVGCQWVTGRWPGKSGLKFRRSSSDRIRANIPGVFNALTFSTWVKVEGLDRPFNALILTKEWDTTKRKVHWQLMQGGQIEFSTTNAGRVVSPVVLKKKNFGKWVMLSVSYDTSTGEIKHYVNGRVVSGQKLDNPKPVDMGICDIGNWSGVNTGNSRRFLHGSMDEFLVMRRVMNEAELLQLYKAGRNEH